MKHSDIKELMISSLNTDTDPAEIKKMLEREGVSYDFSKDFSDVVLRKIFTAGGNANRDVEFLKYMNYAFTRIAISGVAAIVILLISIYMMEGSVSLDSFFGMGDSYDESIICLLTGK